MYRAAVCKQTDNGSSSGVRRSGRWPTKRLKVDWQSCLVYYLTDWLSEHPVPWNHSPKTLFFLSLWKLLKNSQWCVSGTGQDMVVAVIHYTGRCCDEYIYTKISCFIVHHACALGECPAQKTLMSRFVVVDPLVMFMSGEWNMETVSNLNLYVSNFAAAAVAAHTTAIEKSLIIIVV